MVVEAQRAVAENETKAHQVRRGKRDQAELRFWPGGPIPFGLDPVPEFDPRSPARLLGSRLVPSSKTSWFLELQQLVQAEVDKRLNDAPDQRPALQSESDQLEREIKGLALSLADPDLPLAVRKAVQDQYSTVLTRIDDIAFQVRELEQTAVRGNDLVSVPQVLDCLQRLRTVLSQGSATRMNIELAFHIDRIICHPDGHVVLQLCRLGVLADELDFFEETSNIIKSPKQEEGPSNLHAKPRRRARRRIIKDADSSEDPLALAEFAADPHRFAGLGNQWFQEISLQVPEATFPAKELASKAAELRKAGYTQDQIAQELGLTKPTAAKALKIAEEMDEELRSMPRVFRNRRLWHEEMAREVADAKAQGLGTNALMAKFGKSDTTIRKALVYAKEMGLLKEEEEQTHSNDIPASLPHSSSPEENLS